MRYRRDLALFVGCFFLLLGLAIGIGLAGQSEATSWTALGLILAAPASAVVMSLVLKLRDRH